MPQYEASGQKDVSGRRFQISFEKDGRVKPGRRQIADGRYDIYDPIKSSAHPVGFFDVLHGRAGNPYFFSDLPMVWLRGRVMGGFGSDSVDAIVDIPGEWGASCMSVVHAFHGVPMVMSLAGAVYSRLTQSEPSAGSAPIQAVFMGIEIDDLETFWKWAIRPHFRGIEDFCQRLLDGELIESVARPGIYLDKVFFGFPPQGTQEISGMLDRVRAYRLFKLSGEPDKSGPPTDPVTGAHNRPSKFD